MQRVSSRKSRSGAKWNEEQYRAAGYRRMTVRLRNLGLLDALALAQGSTRSQVLERLIASAYEKQLSGITG